MHIQYKPSMATESQKLQLFSIPAELVGGHPPGLNWNLEKKIKKSKAPFQRRMETLQPAGTAAKPGKRLRLRGSSEFWNKSLLLNRQKKRGRYGVSTALWTREQPLPPPDSGAPLLRGCPSFGPAGNHIHFHAAQPPIAASPHLSIPTSLLPLSSLPTSCLIPHISPQLPPLLPSDPSPPTSRPLEGFTMRERLGRTHVSETKLNK